MRVPGLIIGACLLLTACDDSTGPPGSGAQVGSGKLLVYVGTSGGDPDLDGYRLTVDGSVSLSMPATGTQQVTLTAGEHLIELSEVAANCAVNGGATREVALSEGGTTAVQFSVGCSATGVSVRTATTGLDHDPNGYRILLDGASNRVVGSTATAVLSRLPPGTHVVELTDIAPNCELDGPAARTVTVVNAELTPLDFSFDCLAVWAAIRVEVSTTGSDPDGQYRAFVDALPGLAAEVHGGSGVIPRVPAGTHAVLLSEVAANCSVTGAATREATVTVGGSVRDTAHVAFAVECISDRGTIRVTVTTSAAATAGVHHVDLWSYDCYYCPPVESGETDPDGNGTLELTPRSGDYYLGIRPAQGCSVNGSTYLGPLQVTPGAVVDARFEVGCGPALLRVTAPTSGTSQDTEYSVTLWYTDWWTYEGVPIPLGTLPAGGTLTAEAPYAGWFWASLGDVAENCTVLVQNPSAGFELAYGQVKDLYFPVHCGP